MRWSEATPSGGSGGSTQPVLTVAIPTYQRPDDLERAARSVLAATPVPGAAVELVVSDNSPGDESERVAERLLAEWRGASAYVHLPASAGAVGNFNSCVEAASGRWVLILHDDDRLLPGATEPILSAIAAAGPDDRALLFGCRVVDGDGRVLRRQEFRRELRLSPATALRRVLRHSSYVRFPALVVRADAYAEAGPFDDSVGGATDLDMWVRLFAAAGVRCVPATTCEYTVHADTWTTRMFTAATVADVQRIFGRAAQLGVLSPAEIRRCQRHFLHQFVLGGAVRSLRARDRSGARGVLRLFALPEVRELGVSRRWLPVRFALGALTLGAKR